MPTNATQRRLESRQKLMDAMEDYFSACAADNFVFEDDLADVVAESVHINLEIMPN